MKGTVVTLPTESVVSNITIEETTEKTAELDDEETNQNTIESRSTELTDEQIVAIQNHENLQTATAVNQSLRTLPGAFRVPGHNPYSQSDSFPPSPPAVVDEGELQQTDNIALEAGCGDEEVPPVLSAYLVQDEDDDAPQMEIAEAEKVKPFFQRREGQLTIVITGALMACLVTLLGVFLSRGDNNDENSTLLSEVTDKPTPRPTLDPRATLTIVQERGAVNCGIEDYNREGGVNLGEYDIDQCRALAAIIFGDITKINLVTVGADDRYERLLNHEVDVLYAGDTSTLEKSIREVRDAVYILHFMIYISYSCTTTYVSHHLLAFKSSCLFTQSL